MVHTQQPPTSAARSGYDGTDVTGWIAWILFAGIILMTNGFFNVIEGIVALFRDNIYLVGSEGLVLDIDFTAWGWALLLFGVLLIVTGYGVMRGQTWARITGIVLVVINAIVHMIFMPAYPIWAIIVITLDVLVIYALAVHGREAKEYHS
jgi:hypothetical protein